MKTPTINDLVTDAEARTVDLETLALDAPNIAAAVASARAAIGAAGIAAAEVLVSETALAPITVESQNDLYRFAESGARATMPERLAGLLQLAINARHKGLIVGLRGPRSTLLIRESADPGGADTAVDRYVGLVAAVLVDEHPAESKAVLVGLPALRGRIDAAEARHAAHRQAELARIEAEERAAVEAVAAADRAARQELAHFFGAHHERSFVVRNQLFSGGALAGAALRRGTRDQNGDFASFELDELVLLRQQVEAAEAVAAGATAKQGA